jgi:signal transduction histidine kinase/ActR/RegA family two-component response regulator
VLDIHHPSCRKEASHVLEALVETGHPASGELELLRGDGSPLKVAMTATFARDVADGGRIRVIWRDITAEKALETQLLHAQKMDAIGRLSGGVAHDFNNILSVIMGAATLLDDSWAGPPEDKENLELILAAAHRGASLTGDLLAFSRRQIVDPKPIDVRNVLAESERMLGRIIGSNIVVDLHLGDRDLVCLVDRSRLSQVILNLVINARDAMPNGGNLTVEAFYERVPDAPDDQRVGLTPGDYAVIAVTDTGVGMKPEVVARAFEPFYTTKEMGKGTGLGLSMCYGIVQQAGGRISIYSEVGQGTTIKVHLPLVHGADAEARPSTAPRDVPTGHETILVVEDQRELRIVTARILERAGYRVLSAEDGVEAMEIARSTDGPIHLLLTDVMMPRMGGRELADTLRDAHPETRVLYTSGYTANSIVTRGALHPDTAFLAKPATPAVLLGAVRRVLSGEKPTD